MLTLVVKTFEGLHPKVTTKQNFDVLLVPPDHSTRSLSDNYYYDEKTCLRAHMTAHSVDLMKENKAFLSCGDVYRRDEIDATHYPVFHQIDGVRVFSKEEYKKLNKDPSLSFEDFVVMRLQKDLEGWVKSM